MEDTSTPPLVQLDTGSLRIEASGLTDIGLRRTRNEDALGLLPEVLETAGPQQGYLFAVADGMGGARKGDVASLLAIDALFATYYDSDADSAPELPPAAALKAAYNAANDAVFAEREQIHGSMGTTLVSCAIAGDTAIVGNVGDSRAYLFRDGKLRQISQDHSFVAEQVRDGILTPEEARHSPQRNIITRAVGHLPTVDADQFTVQLQPGDLLLLCSDGLHGMVADDELAALAQTTDLRQAAQQYIAAANAHGGHDNITCLLVRVLPSDSSA